MAAKALVRLCLLGAALTQVRTDDEVPRRVRRQPLRGGEPQPFDGPPKSLPPPRRLVPIGSHPELRPPVRDPRRFGPPHQGFRDNSGGYIPPPNTNGFPSTGSGPPRFLPKDAFRPPQQPNGSFEPVPDYDSPDYGHHPTGGRDYESRDPPPREYDSRGSPPRDYDSRGPPTPDYDARRRPPPPDYDSRRSGNENRGPPPPEYDSRSGGPSNSRGPPPPEFDPRFGGPPNSRGPPPPDFDSRSGGPPNTRGPPPPDYDSRSRGPAESRGRAPPPDYSNRRPADYDDYRDGAPDYRGLLPTSQGRRPPPPDYREPPPPPHFSPSPRPSHGLPPPPRRFPQGLRPARPVQSFGRPDHTSSGYPKDPPIEHLPPYKEVLIGATPPVEPITVPPPTTHNAYTTPRLGSYRVEPPRLPRRRLETAGVESTAAAGLPGTTHRLFGPPFFVDGDDFYYRIPKRLLDSFLKFDG